MYYSWPPYLNRAQYFILLFYCMRSITLFFGLLFWTRISWQIIFFGDISFQYVCRLLCSSHGKAIQFTSVLIGSCRIHADMVLHVLDMEFGNCKRKSAIKVRCVARLTR